jgi:hypothetical protein
MPLFGKPDEAKKYFEEAKRCVQEPRKKFNPDEAIRLLENAVMLKPNEDKYRRKLEEIREFKKRIITSSSSQYPTPRDVFLYLLGILGTEGHHMRVHQLRDNTRWVAVSHTPPLVVVPYPYDEDPNQFMPRMGIEFPAGYSFLGWVNKREAVFRCAESTCLDSELADTIDKLFIKLLGAPHDYVVQGWLEKSR